MHQLKTYLSLGCFLAVLIVGHHFNPIATDVFAVVFALILIVIWLQMYFMPIERKRENIAKFKARHGIPVNESHKVDEMLQRGFFRSR
jgi:hypothetical protein